MTNETSTTAATSKNLTKILSLLDAYQECHSTANDALKKSLWNLYKARRNRQVNSLTVCDNLHFTAQTVRTEFEPQLMLLLLVTSLTDDGDDNDDANNVSELVDEEVTTDGKGKQESESKKDKNTESDQLFVLVDRATHFEQQQKKKKELEKENNQQSLDAIDATDDAGITSTSMGLRRRKKGDEKNAKKKKKKKKDDDDDDDASSQKWTKEDVAPKDDDDDEESSITIKNNHGGDDPLQLLGGASQPHELAVAREEARKALNEYIQAANLLRAILQTATATQQPECSK